MIVIVQLLMAYQEDVCDDRPVEVDGDHSEEDEDEGARDGELGEVEEGDGEEDGTAAQTRPADHGVRPRVLPLQKGREGGPKDHSHNTSQHRHQAEDEGNAER